MVSKNLALKICMFFFFSFWGGGIRLTRRANVSNSCSKRVFTIGSAAFHLGGPSALVASAINEIKNQARRPRHHSQRQSRLGGCHQIPQTVQYPRPTRRDSKGFQRAAVACFVTSSCKWGVATRSPKLRSISYQGFQRAVVACFVTSSCKKLSC